jgi:large conductance mechanosensitive channel
MRTPRFLQEFKEFLSRDNVIELAVGIIIGTAFGKIVNSLVNDMVMPPLGLLLQGVNCQNLFLALNGRHYETLQAAQTAGVATINYGNFITVVMQFFIIGASVFFLLRAVTTFRIRLTRLPTPLTKTEQLLTEIRDLLREE